MSTINDTIPADAAEPDVAVLSPDKFLSMLTSVPDNPSGKLSVQPARLAKLIGISRSLGDEGEEFPLPARTKEFACLAEEGEEAVKGLLDNPCDGPLVL